MGKFAWFILGLILGAALALAGVTLTGHAPGQLPADEEAAPAPAAVTRLPVAPEPEAAERILRPSPTPPRVRPPVETMRAAPPPDDRDQVAEDAAAAGMTSRARRNEPASAPEDELPPY